MKEVNLDVFVATWVGFVNLGEVEEGMGWAVKLLRDTYPKQYENLRRVFEKADEVLGVVLFRTAALEKLASGQFYESLFPIGPGYTFKSVEMVKGPVGTYEDGVLCDPPSRQQWPVCWTRNPARMPAVQ